MMRIAASLLFLLTALPAGAQSPPEPKPGVAGCAGPVMELLTIKLCELDPGKSVRAFCTDGRTLDIVATDGNAQVPASCSQPR